MITKPKDEAGKLKNERKAAADAPWSFIRHPSSLRRRSPIGLDLGARRIKAIQIEFDRSGPRVAAAAIAPRAGGGAAGAAVSAAEISAVADLLYRTGFEGRHVVLAAPAESLIHGLLDLPPRASQAPVEQIARLELARAHKCAAESFEMGCWDLPAPHRGGGGARGTHLMAVGLPHADANALLDAFEPAGLRVRAIDVPSGALARACAGLSADAGRMTAVLDVGWGAAVLSLLHKESVIYHRGLTDAGLSGLHANLGRRLGLDYEGIDYLLSQVGFGADQRGEHGGEPAVASQLPTGLPARRATDGAEGLGGADDLEMPDDGRAVLFAHADDMIRELEVSFTYATHQYPDASVGRLLLVGGGAKIPGLAARLSAGLHVPVTPVAPADLVACDGALSDLCASPSLTAALGLALFGKGE